MPPERHRALGDSESRSLTSSGQQGFIELWKGTGKSDNSGSWPCAFKSPFKKPFAAAVAVFQVWPSMRRLVHRRTLPQKDSPEVQAAPGGFLEFLINSQALPGDS